MMPGRIGTAYLRSFILNCMAKNKKHSIFLDSNVFIAAALSRTGGSFRIINESRQENITLYANDFVIAEVARIMRKKFPEKIDSAYRLISSAQLVIEKNPSAKEVQKISELIDDIKDAPILAGALKRNVECLITLDKKHFMSDKLKSVNLPIKILTPKEFIENYLK